jgi:hypothetical protein
MEGGGDLTNRRRREGNGRMDEVEVPPVAGHKDKLLLLVGNWGMFDNY